MNLIEVRAAQNGTLPFTQNTIYKLHSQKRYPNIIFKVCGKLVFDMDEYQAEAERCRKKSVEQAKQVRQCAQV
ncbi:MAG: hypothetical protein Q3M24_01795 [Candidatus Electrothrix aestuarii]|uniref:Uncharacterized protein n=1 Tax=Candidatus Electrothrix aestuarii TaxID=3062594 RepID=A0AAU8LWW8_9BACT|nr:hypothetical protein [Candidatus Electrothrix aestuarii]